MRFDFLNWNLPRCSKLLAATICAIGMAVPAQSQSVSDPPGAPRHDTVSPTGVSLVSGTFTHSEQDLQIGEGEFPHSLSLVRRFSGNKADSISLYDNIAARGWSINLSSYLTTSAIFLDLGNIDPGLIGNYPISSGPINNQPFQYSVVQGNSSAGFFEIASPSNGNFSGPFNNLTLRSPEKLEVVAGSSPRRFKFTTKDESELIFRDIIDGLTVESHTARDGTRLDYNYNGIALRSVFSNRGLAIIMEAPNGELTKACAVNRAYHYVGPLSSCPAGVPAVTYDSSATVAGGFKTLNSVTNAEGETTNYVYDPDSKLLTCIKQPGQSQCSIQNTYNTCVKRPDRIALYPVDKKHAQVTSQVTATGETYTYNNAATTRCPPDPIAPAGGAGGTVTFSDNGVISVNTSGGGPLTYYKDQLNRQTDYEYLYTDFLGSKTNLGTVKMPGGNEIDYEYDIKGNQTKITAKAKPGSGLADRVWNYAYGACNQQTMIQDPKGNQTDITYDSTHCGMLTKTGPAVGGIRPQTRYEYAQRYAWIKNSSGGYVQAATPVWVLVKEEYCKTSAASGTGCAGGAADEVVTTYDYGPNSGPNNLWLRSTVVDDGGLSLRTCYQYDEYGRKIAETQPEGTGGSCP